MVAIGAERRLSRTTVSVTATTSFLAADILNAGGRAYPPVPTRPRGPGRPIAEGLPSERRDTLPRARMRDHLMLLIDEALRCRASETVRAAADENARRDVEARIGWDA